MNRHARPRRQRTDRRGGFTLMEVLLVLAILVILGTFAVTNFGTVFAGAKIKAARSQLAEFKTPLSIYQMDIGSFPDNNTGLEALRTPPPDIDATKWNGPYLSSEIPLDPWEHPYQYEQGQDASSYRVFSLGPDGQGGTDDDIQDGVGIS